jgi:hypothetical protein
VAGVGVVGGASWGVAVRGGGVEVIAPAAPTATTDASPQATVTPAASDCATAAALLTDTSATAYPNGQLPVEVLCAVDGSWTIPVTLRGDAGVALEAALERARSLGMEVCAKDGYVDLDQQERRLEVRGYEVFPVGGTSHGTGLAFDMCGSDYDAFDAFAAVAADFGWTRDFQDQDWGPDHEPWHFEFQPGTSQPAELTDVRLTVVEGKTLEWVSSKLAAAYGASLEDATAAITASVQEVIPEAATAEGWPMPSDYELSGAATVNDAADLMVSARVQELTDLGVPRAEWQEVITMASLVQAETPREADMPKTARVIQNRLDKGIHLQLDSTVLYLDGVDGAVFVTQEEREAESPYNTYLHPGLPPGAIGSPSDAAIDAVLHPADGDWLYFVTVNLETGEMLFATTYEEHLANVGQLRAWIDEQEG